MHSIQNCLIRRRWLLCLALMVWGPATGCNPLKPFQRVGFEIEDTQTEDGWTLVCQRYRTESLDPERTPVVLCHGFSCNAEIYDLTPENSLAMFLARKGFDVWAVNLRGSGPSTTPGFMAFRKLLRPTIPELPRVMPNTTINITKFNWTIDDHIDRDVPAILKLVTEKTGHDGVIWLGHSMGGSIALARLARHGDSRIKGFVGISTNITIPIPPNNIMKAVAQGGLTLKMADLIIGHNFPTTLAGHAGIHLGDTLMYNRQNMESATINRMYRYVMTDEPPGVLGQQMDIINSGNYQSADGQFVYSKHMDKVNVPMLLMVGKLDNMCPPECSRYIYNNVSSKDKTFHLLGLINGFEADYGHFDTLLGTKAAVEVYPLISDWLDRHKGLSTRTALPEEKAPPTKPDK